MENLVAETRNEFANCLGHPQADVADYVAGGGVLGQTSDCVDAGPVVCATDSHWVCTTQPLAVLALPLQADRRTRVLSLNVLGFDSYSKTDFPAGPHGHYLGTQHVSLGIGIDILE